MKHHLFNLERSAHAEFPAEDISAEQWNFLLNYAIRAPSFYNTQPWLFHAGYTYLDILADRRRLAPVADPTGRKLFMSCGCLLFHLTCAMRQFRCLGSVEILPSENPDLVARVHFGTSDTPTPEWTSLFEAIPKRRTNRHAYAGDSLPPELIEDLHSAAHAEGAWLHTFTEYNDKLCLAETIFEGDKAQWEIPDFRLELAQWIYTQDNDRRDGIPAYALPDDDLFSYPNPYIERTLETEEGQIARHHALVSGSPVLAVLASTGDTARYWLSSGLALDRLLLRAASSGVYASFLSQPIDSPPLRAKIGAMIGGNIIPQVLLRLGFGGALKPTPRRDVEEMLV